ncbi:hypothetical protein C479_12047 [Halovivax asiaticus JCM 14624]|uniref:Inner membrane protein YgaP-like transmembrane domain-containing protein n=1 Tax=Halovivax asiaticus JCM 14624 TaxID=1227490 RepID=M0BF72_9EURY|nr:DUF2892 domain-containing protein [Halovivax asiaticus]ELZ09117.1 hypothetical protein C479_12047 [Halovivax asiaticus JCM 14624]
MEKNVGGTDRTMRLVVGSILALVGVAILAGWLGVGGTLGTGLGVLALLAGLVLLFTGVTQLCVVNRLLGIDTSRGR